MRKVSDFHGLRDLQTKAFSVLEIRGIRLMGKTRVKKKSIRKKCRWIEGRHYIVKCGRDSNSRSKADSLRM